MPNNSIFNPELIHVARLAAQSNRDKSAFVDGAAAAGADPAAGGGAPAGDPMAGPMPAMAPGDPAAGGGDPMAGGDPPPDPMAGGGGGDIMGMITQAVQAAMGGGGAAGAGGEPIKPKIDVNVEIMQMKKLLARIADHLKIPIPAADMVATSDDLTQMGMESQGAGAGGAPPTSAIAPPEGIAPAMPMPADGGGEKAGQQRGRAVPQFTDMRQLSNRAGALAAVLRKQTGAY